MRSLEIKKDIYWVGSLDPNLRIFDIIMYTPYGTTYNSYVVKGSEKTAVFETVKEQFFPEYLEKLLSLNIDVHHIDYIIVDHTEPDHAGSVGRLLELSPKAKVVGSTAAIHFLKQIVNKPFNSIAVADGDFLDLGNKTLRFISAPFLHWPDSIYTYLEEDKILFTCDSFGSHYCSFNVFNDMVENEENYMEALRYYYDCIFGPFKPYILKAIDKIKDLNIETICPGHGPILREDPLKIVNIYKEWSTPAPKNNIDKITISYVSAYGYTKQLAEKIAEGIRACGEYDIKMYDVIHHKQSDILEDINESVGILFGSPTINGDLLEPIRDLLTKLNPIVHGNKVAGAFGSYGWSGEAVPNMERRLKELKMDILLPSLKINFKPSEEDLLKAFKFGKSFSEKLQNKNTTKNIDDKKNKTKLWKCVICGEVFEGDAPPEICPVCGASKEQFIEVKNEDTGFRCEKQETFVILGNGAAGYYAADAIRKRNPIATIKMISKEKTSSYYRPQLSDLINEEIENSDFYIAPQKWYEEKNIEQILGVLVAAIDPNKNVVVLEDGTEIYYDKLILANGSHNFIPPTKVTLEDMKDKIGDLVLTAENYKKIGGIFTLRDLNDALEIKEFAKEGKKAVVVGGGLLGLEAAWELKNKGLHVTVVELATRLLPKQLDNEGAEIFKNITKDSGINLILGAEVSEIVTDKCTKEAGAMTKVSKIKLGNGELIDCDLVLFSVGIRPNKALAEKAGISCDKGIIVNSSMETNMKNIYAAGDVAELNSIIFGNWPAAIEMGKVAGANAANDKVEFQGFVSSVIFNALNTNIFSAGTLNFDDGTLQQLSLKDSLNGIYKKLFFKEGKLVGGILLGDTSKSAKIIAAIDGEYTMDKIITENII